MANSHSGTRTSTMRLILVPAIVTLSVTVLRLVGELQHRSPKLFNTSAGGGAALVGIAWLPFIFGPYFAIKLAGSGEGPSGTGKSIGFAVLGLIVMIGGRYFAFAVQPLVPSRILAGLTIEAVGAALTFPGWGALSRTLLVYAFAARIPVVIVMFFAMQGSWGTHYDALPAGYSGPTDLLPKFLAIGVLPQLVFWVAFTIVIGSLFGTIAGAIARRDKPTVQTAT